MRVFGLFISAVFCIAFNSSRIYGNYGNYYNYDSTNYGTNISQYVPPAQYPSTVTYSNSLPYYSFETTQPPANNYNAVSAYKNAVSQSIPLVDSGDPNLPSNIMFTATERQELRIKMLNKQAYLKDYSARENERNDKLMRENTWEKDSGPSRTERSRSGYNTYSEGISPR